MSTSEEAGEESVVAEETKIETDSGRSRRPKKEIAKKDSCGTGRTHVVEYRRSFRFCLN